MKHLYTLVKAGGFIDFVDLNEIELIQPDGVDLFSTVRFKSGYSTQYTSSSIQEALEAYPIEIYSVKEDEADA